MSFTQAIDLDVALEGTVTSRNELATDIYGEYGPIVTDLIGGGSDVFQQLGELMSVVSAEVERPYGAAGGTATIEVVFPDQVDLDVFTLTASPGLDITGTVALATTLGESNQYFEDTLFTGTLTTVSQNKEGIVTLEFSDKRYQLNKYNVRLDTGDGAQVDTIARDLLTESSLDLAEGEPGGFVIDIDDPIEIDGTFGLEEGKDLYQVLETLARKQQAFLFIDRQNTVNFVTTPVSRKIYARNIIEIEAGDSNQDTGRVLVKTTQNSESGAFDVTGYQQKISVAGHTLVGSSGSGNSEKAKKAPTIDDPNVTEKGARRRAGSEYINQVQSASSGTVTILGNPVYRIHDTVVVEDLPNYVSLPEGTYTVKRVLHTIDSSNGYTTELELSPDIGEAYANMFELTDYERKIKDTFTSEEDDPFDPTKPGDYADLTTTGQLANVLLQDARN